MLARAIRRAAVLLAVSASVLGAQQYFGQNQVQYDEFDWRVLETEHFLVYYYPQERVATVDAARMAERAYARLSVMLDHKFREKKPIVLFTSRADFGQNNVTGDLGEFTGGVTDALRHRMLVNFTGDYRSFEHVLTHEMVHAFQYDIFAHGKAGAGLQSLAQVNPPLWFAEGMAEYLSLGPTTPFTDAWIRDAALNGKIPTVEQMTDHPEQFFPYRYGHSFWAYIGKQWGDASIAQIMHAIPTIGVERAFKRELGLSLEEIGDRWKDDMQVRYLPDIGDRERPRNFAKPLLTEKRSGGEIFLAPALSSDGRYIVFLSNGNFNRGQVFIDLWLGDATTGKRLKRLVKSTTDPDFEELRLLYSQSSFSPDGKLLAFTAQRSGRDVLYLLDVEKRKTIKRFDLPLESVTGPSWSPDGKRIVFSGTHGGLTDLYIVGVDGKNMRQLTDDRFGDLQPQWSPDGRTIAFASDRGDDRSFELLRFPRWRITLLDLAENSITIIPGQDGLNTNPQWAPDSKSIAFVSDRTGTANVFLYDFDDGDHYQLTNVMGAVSAATEYSPAITWAAGADRLAFTYYEDGEYTIWSVANPRSLKREPYRAPPVAPAIVATAAPVNSTTPEAGTDSRSIAAIDTGDTALDASPDSAAAISVVALLDSMEFALPDTTKFRDEEYSIRFQPDYVARPSVGYSPDNYGRNMYGGTTVIMSDMLGNNRLAFSGSINGRVSESRLFVGYTGLAKRWQFSGGLSQSPYYFLSRDFVGLPDENDTRLENQEITTYIARQAFAVTSYPLNRFTRIEVGGGFNNIDRERWFISRKIYDQTEADPFNRDSTVRDPTINYVDGQLAFVSDNTLFGYTGPIMGRRYRFQISPVVGTYRWVEYLADYRRYDPIIFNYLTLATRLYANISVGPNETAFPKYIARPDFIRGYDRNNSFYSSCPVLGANPSNCSAVQLLGSRVMLGNVELRFPLIRQVQLGLLPLTLPPLEGLLFYDEGVAWSSGQSLSWTRPEGYDLTRQRFPLRSYGFGLRLNLFNYAIVRWDYAIPLDQPGRRGFWTWSLWPSF